MFSEQVIKGVCAAADAAGLGRAEALALVEVETSGATFEQDGRTPQFLYERHVAWREAAKRSSRLQAAFAAAGLAIPKWSRSTQYKDQGSSAKRLDLIRRARAIDEETANRSASWGIGQTMGFLAEELGFSNANAMVDHMTGNLAGQVECMIRELQNKRLIGPLNAHNWPTVARIYNGAGYAANRYDTRLADACKRWQRKLAGAAGVMTSPPADGLSGDEIKALQKLLREKGYPRVGIADGVFGKDTIGALSSFQAHEGLPVTGRYDAATRAALAEAVPPEPARERKDATARDLREAGSKTIKAADNVSLAGKAKIIIGGLIAGGGEASREGLLDQAQSGIEKAQQAKSIWDSVTDLAQPLFGHPIVFVAAGALIIAGIAVVWLARTVRAHRVADHNSGVHAGPGD
jgi:hypothetical protein